MALTTQEAAKKLREAGLQYEAADVTQLAGQNIFLGAQKDTRGVWQIPEEDIDQFIQQQKYGQKRLLKKNRWKWAGAVIASAFALFMGFLLFNSGLKDTLDLFNQYIRPMLTVATPVSMAELTSNPTEKRTAVPTAIPTEPVIEQALIGDNDTSYKIKIVIFNPLNRDILAKEMWIDQDIAFKTDFTCAPPPVTYILSDTVVVTGTEDGRLHFTTTLQSNDPNIVGYDYNAQGSTWKNGCFYNLSLSFPVSFVITKHEYTSFYILIPRKFHVLRVEDRFAPSVEQKEDSEWQPISFLHMPSNFGQFSEYSILFRIATSDGEMLAYRHDSLK